MSALDTTADTHIVMENLSKIFETAAGEITAVKNINLRVRKGDFVTITGPNGSGKTTLLNLIGGMTEPSDGLILIEGLCLEELTDGQLSRFRGEKIGFIFQFASLIPSLTVLENVCLPAFLTNKEPKKTVIKRATAYIEQLGLANKIESRPAQLSGGQQRRAAIARALINEPGIILADEPTGDIDEETGTEIIEMLHRINRERDVTVFLATHNSKIASTGGLRLKMKDGQINNFTDL
jgi:ABC-type lipoprotein export system ATPase subunit